MHAHGARPTVPAPVQPYRSRTLSPSRHASKVGYLGHGTPIFERTAAYNKNSGHTTSQYGSNHVRGQPGLHKLSCPQRTHQGCGHDARHDGMSRGGKDVCTALLRLNAMDLSSVPRADV
eukprot:scaffold7854_cov76-Phaeocystis_antarctica.AAC.5